MGLLTEHVILVADSSKFDRKAPAFVAPIEHISTLVTDADLPADCKLKCEAAGTEVGYSYSPTRTRSSVTID